MGGHVTVLSIYSLFSLILFMLVYVNLTIKQGFSFCASVCFSACLYVSQELFVPSTSNIVFCYFPVVNVADL